MSKPATIKEIIAGAKKYLPHLNEERLMRAYDLAKKAHEGQARASGEPYVQHPLEVAKILLTFEPDEDSLVVALLHDVLEDTPIGIEVLKKEFGERVVPLLKGLEKLGKVHFTGQERQIENLRKMFLAMAKDIRVILVKLADRLHNMRTLAFVPEHKRKRIAEETLNVYCPIAARLGIYELKAELDDLAFKYLYPEDYERLRKEMEGLTRVQQKIIKTSQKILGAAMKKAGLDAEVEGRVKHLYSIYKKLRRKGKNYVSELYDVLALRLLVDTEAQCYQALGVIHKNWTPLSHRFKDYIAVPKPNGYQSLHTTLIGLCPDLHNQPIEVQIRTREMNQVAKYGIAAHWTYKEKGVLTEDKLRWVKGLVDLQDTLKSNSEFVASLNVDIFSDRIFALTPKGDVLDLPAKATPVDFAYGIHTSVGHRCKGAKVNGKIVPLDYALKNGDVVEVLTGNVEQPNRYWLSFVVTSHARQHIKQWFTGQNDTNLVRLGKEMLNAQLKRFGQPVLDAEYSLLKHYDQKTRSLKDREQLLTNIGSGTLDPMDVIKKILPEEKVLKRAPVQAGGMSAALTEGVEFEKKAEVLITGEKGFKTQIASCCQPKPNDPIIGYITRGRGVTIHKKGCKLLRGSATERLISVSWSTQKNPQFTVMLELKRRSRIGLLRDVADVFARNQLPILDIRNVRHEDTDLGEMVITASMDTMDTLNQIITQLLALPGIFGVKEVG